MPGSWPTLRTRRAGRWPWRPRPRLLPTRPTPPGLPSRLPPRAPELAAQAAFGQAQASAGPAAQAAFGQAQASAGPAAQAAFGQAQASAATAISAGLSSALGQASALHAAAFAEAAQAAAAAGGLSAQAGDLGRLGGAPPRAALPQGLAGASLLMPKPPGMSDRRFRLAVRTSVPHKLMLSRTWLELLALAGAQPCEP